MSTGVNREDPLEEVSAVSPELDAILGVLVGTAVGDAMGLPMEGLSARRQQCLFPLPLRHRLVGSFGMMSDDTEHTVMLAQALLEHPNDPGAFQRCFGWKLRWWLLSLPAGVGFATLRAVLKLWMGFPPTKSGVSSAGNGPAMRTALLGVFFANERQRRTQFVAASTTLTHLDPRAEIAAQAVAETAAWMTGQRDDVYALTDSLAGIATLPEWTSIVTRLRESLSSDQSTTGFASSIGAKDGVSGYAFQSVPVGIYAAIRHRNSFEAALTEAIGCGGDTDTVGAITGALVGVRVGVHGIPAPWRNGLLEWPRSLPFLLSLGERLTQQTGTSVPLGGVPYFWPLLPVRNLVFLAIVLVHGLRRLLPPF